MIWSISKSTIRQVSRCSGPTWKGFDAQADEGG